MNVMAHLFKIPKITRIIITITNNQLKRKINYGKMEAMAKVLADEIVEMLADKEDITFYFLFLFLTVSVFLFLMNIIKKSQ